MDHTHTLSIATSPHPLPPIPPSDLSPTANLIPAPLFTPRQRPKHTHRPPPLTIACAVLEEPHWLPSAPSPTFSWSSSAGSINFTTAPTSPTLSASSASSCSASSPGPPPPYDALSPSWAGPPPPYAFHFQSSSSPTAAKWPNFASENSWKARAGGGTHALRRKKSPKELSLRALRERESDACLQRMYERQTMAYLDGSVFGAAPRRAGGRRFVEIRGSD